MPQPSLRYPFPSLPRDSLLGIGSSGHVFAVSERVVVKVPICFEHPTARHVEMMEESAQGMHNERMVYEILSAYPHPSILHFVLGTPQGLFLERAATTLDQRINQAPLLPIPLHRQCVWMRQLTSAVTWLEQLGLVHGDLRPQNVLISSAEEVKLADFDCTVKIGEQLRAATQPYCRVDEYFEPPVAGPATEQFALGSCFYTVRQGVEPYHDLESLTAARKLALGDFPAAIDDEIFGDIIHKCWHGRFDSVLDLGIALDEKLDERGWWRHDPGAAICDEDLAESLLDECHKFIADNTEPV